ncbi:MAG: SAM-dependent tRNA/rRNA cytosine-C5 methylase [Candidatus Asgardarchaeum californiense]|nr:MAG: SAM-dependent tRNA/rRNA cytosine-C5 methylase [Candidatus Asgardarchaeum californiense]
MLLKKSQLDYLAKKYNYPLYMIDRFSKMFSTFNELIDFLDANETPPPVAIRINTLKIAPEELIIRLSKKGFKLKDVPWISYVKIIDYAPYSLSSLPEYLLGYFFIQDLASVIPPMVLSPSEKDIVLDMCAAPGGKTTHLAQLMGNQGFLFAVDISNKRISALKSNLARMGIRNTIVFQFNAKNIHLLNIKFDKILLDAPCTGEGLIRVDKSRKWKRSIRDINFMSQIQYTLLERAVSVLKTGGTIVYSTCSTTPEENEFVISKLLKNHGNIHVEPIELPIGRRAYTSIFGKVLQKEIAGGIRLFPHTDNTIGFFVCKLKKVKHNA